MHVKLCLFLSFIEMLGTLQQLQQFSIIVMFPQIYIAQIA